MLKWWFELNRKYDAIPEPSRFLIFIISIIIVLTIPMILQMTILPMIKPDLINLGSMCIIGIMRFVYIKYKS